jgi:hypothetical protein
MNDLVFVPTKTTGNFMIYKNELIKKRKRREKIFFDIDEISFPFGAEEYNDGFILNMDINDMTNTRRNHILDMELLAKKMRKMKNDLSWREIMRGHDFYDFIKYKSSFEDGDENVKIYQIRGYIKNGAKITDNNGEVLKKSQLKNGKGKVKLDISSLWINNSSKKYGLNIYVSNIVLDSVHNGNNFEQDD